MSIKTQLDDAAAHATADRRIDLAQALERADAGRSGSSAPSRRHGALVVLAVAAVIALIAVLLPSGSVLGVRVMPADEPAPMPAMTGVPAKWYYAPPWTPPVTRHPMTAAVMVLEAGLSYGGLARRTPLRAPVLVSADGLTYASLPFWSDHDAGLQLSKDGRRVAWYTVGQNTTPSMVHLLTLATSAAGPPCAPSDQILSRTACCMRPPI